MNPYFQAALALIQIVAWFMGKLDEKKKAEAMALLWDQEFMKRDKEIIERANRVRSDVERDLRDHPDRVRDSDGFERKP